MPSESPWQHAIFFAAHYFFQGDSYDQVFGLVEARFPGLSDFQKHDATSTGERIVSAGMRFDSADRKDRLASIRAPQVGETSRVHVDKVAEYVDEDGQLHYQTFRGDFAPNTSKGAALDRLERMAEKSPTDYSWGQKGAEGDVSLTGRQWYKAWRQ